MNKIIQWWHRVPEKQFVLITLLLVLLIRVAYILTLDEKWYFYDTIHYDKAAQHIVNGEGFGPSLHFSNLYANYCLEPVYPLFLAGIYAILGHSFFVVRIIQSLFGLGTLLLLYSLGKRILPAKWARWVLIIGGFYPFFIYIAGLLYVTQVFTFFLVLSVWGMARYSESYYWPWLLLVAAAIGLAVLSIPVYLLSIPFFLGWLLFTRQPAFKRILAFVILGAGLLLAFTPWTLRNYMVFGTPSYARACVSEGLVYSHTYWNIEREKALAVDTVDVRTFSVSIYNSDEKSYVDCFINGKFYFTLSPYENLTIPDSAHVGLLFAGRVPNYLDRFSAYRLNVVDGDTIKTEVFGTADAPAAIMDKEIEFNPPIVHYKGAEHFWKYRLVFQEQVNANYFTLHYPETIKPKKLDRIAMLLYLDGPSLQADGLMVWLHPWKEPDMWWYRDGSPYESVPVTKAFAQQEKGSMFYMLSQHPVEYITKQYIPEFLNFWTPVITKVISQGREPGLGLQIVSVVTFTPLLILLPVGIWALRKKPYLLALLLIPILSISGGYTLFFSQTRYRIPLDGILILFAVLGVYTLTTFFTKKNRNQDV